MGILATDGATLVPQQGFNGMAVTINAPSTLLSGFDIDISSPNTTAGITVNADEWFLVDNIDYRGRGDHDGESSPFAFNFSVHQSSGKGLARNLTARHGAAIAHYKGGGGRGGMWIGPANNGTVRIENCYLAEFANNGIYASRTQGDVEVVGGTYRNNNVASIRIGGRGSFLKDADIVVDMTDYYGPRTRFDEVFATRGIVVEQGPETDSKPPGAVIEGCSIDLASSPTRGAGISAWSTGRTLDIIDTEIRIGIEGYRGVFRAPQVPLGNRPPSAFPRYVNLENVDISAEAGDVTPLDIADAPDSTLRNCRIRQYQGDDVGLVLTRSPDTVIEGGLISVGGPLARLQDIHSITPENCLLSADGTVDDGGSEQTISTQLSDILTADSCLSLDQSDDASQSGALDVLRIADGRIYYRFGTS